MSNVLLWLRRYWLSVAAIAVFIFILRMSNEEHPLHAVWKSPNTVEIEGKLYHVKLINDK